MRTGWVGVFACCAVAVDASAQEFAQHAAHEHGTVIFNIAVEQSKLAVELEAPAVNVVGFEHAPRSEEERKAASGIVAALESGRGLFGVPAGASCRLAEAKAHTPDEQGIELEGGEDHSGADGHRDYRVRYSFNCANPAELAWIELWVLKKLRDVTEARVNILTSSKQTTQQVTSARARVSLR